MPINFPTPERCLLVQAAHWFIDRTRVPLPDDVYRRRPVELKAENSELRELFLALQLADFDMKTPHLRIRCPCICFREIAHAGDDVVTGSGQGKGGELAEATVAAGDEYSRQDDLLDQVLPRWSARHPGTAWAAPYLRCGEQ